MKKTIRYDPKEPSKYLVEYVTSWTTLNLFPQVFGEVKKYLETEFENNSDGTVSLNIEIPINPINRDERSSIEEMVENHNKLTRERFISYFLVDN